MKPQEDYRNGDDGDSSDSSGSEAAALEQELSLHDAEAPARALAALNALRKSRQHYDLVLLARGEEVPAHRAVLAAASPLLLRALQPGAAAHSVDVEADALRELVEYSYTGRLRVRDMTAARRLYRAAVRLRVEPARAHLAERLLRRAAPPCALQLRALPELAPAHVRALDKYIAEHFGAVCASGALAALPQLRLELLRETSAEGGDEAPLAVAEAALAWLRDQPDVDLEELCARTHLLYVDSAGALRDCGDLPESRGDAPELAEYRREAAGRRVRRAPDLPERERPPGSVLAAERLAGSARATRALLALGPELVAARLAWSAALGGAAMGGRLGGEARAPMAAGRCALGAAVLGGALLAVGGYDRARVLRAAERYEAGGNEWSALPDMRVARARFPAATLGDKLYVVGGSDGHNELDSVDVWNGAVWSRESVLPQALSHAAAAADEAAGALYVVGGWAGGASLRQVLKYSVGERAWSSLPALAAGRSQCGGALWGGALWALGGCDKWHCLASTETLSVAEGARCWVAGPALPTARRSVGAAVWRARLVVAGGSDGAASLRRTEWLAPGADAWRGGPALQRPRAGPGLVALGDALFAVGGFDGKEFLSCVECLYEPEGEWTSLRAPPSPAPTLPPSPAPPGEPEREQVTSSG